MTAVGSSRDSDRHQGFAWGVARSDDWDGDDTVHGVISERVEGTAWEVPIGEALARGFHPTKSRVQVQAPPNMTPWTPADEEPFEKWWGGSVLPRLTFWTPIPEVLLLVAVVIALVVLGGFVGALGWVGNLGGGVGWAVLFAGLAAFLVYAWRRRR